MDVKRKGYLLDVGYIIKNNKTYARLTLRGKKIVNIYIRKDPYFYVDTLHDNVKPEDSLDQLRKTSTEQNGLLIKPKDVKIIEMRVRGKIKKLVKIICHRPPDVPILVHATPFKHYEYSIPYSRRVIMDLKLVPMALIRYVRRGPRVLKIDNVDEEDILHPSIFSLDIETYNKGGMSDPRTDPILMISYGTKSETKVLTYKKTNVSDIVTLKSESDILFELSNRIQEIDPDLIVGYNTTNFDIPYIAERVRQFHVDFKLGLTPSFRSISKGQIKGIKIPGRIHVDLYPIVRFFGHTGIINTQNYTLKEVYQNIFNKPPVKVSRKDIWEFWDSDDIDELSRYSLSDAKITYEVAEYVLPIVQELSRTSRMLFFDSSLATAGQFVESLLMYRAKKKGMIIPPRPKDAEIRARLINPIVGAFVKLPEPGIYDNIVVLDFRGLYPSIITSYNIDPFTLCSDKNGGCVDVKETTPTFPSPESEHFYGSPSGARFKKEPKGLIPEVLEELIIKRSKIKKQLKEMKKDTEKRNSELYKKLKSRSQALKILSNSFYGYLVYARSRWYCRECGESVTALGRKHIQETMNTAKKFGFDVLYGDTDSVFLLTHDKTKDEVFRFLKDVNDNLPGTMELELEDFYTRGVFVSKKGSEKGRGAKKKYALLSENGSIKIRGFELVRRDWSKIARKTQYDVLEAILKDGSKEKAVAIVRDVINRLKKRKVPKEELVISTQLNKDPDDYVVTSPELSAALKLKKSGKKIKKGTIVEYIITNHGKSISEKAVPLELFKDGDYDANYYINHQILPSTLKILGELGYDEYALKEGGKQKGLGSWM